MRRKSKVKALDRSYDFFVKHLIRKSLKCVTIVVVIGFIPSFCLRLVGCSACTLYLGQLNMLQYTHCVIENVQSR